MIDLLRKAADPAVDRILRMEHPLLIAILALVIVHLILMPFCVEYDINYWSYVTRNIRAGYGLYELDGYYYTPVWGYVISFVNMVSTHLVPGLGLLSVRVFGALGVEAIDPTYFTTATTVSLTFAYLIKIPLMVSNIVMAYLVHWLVMDATQSRRKAMVAFFLTGLCPIIIGTTCLTGMPDTFSATFILLTIILVRKDYPLIAGMTFAAAVLTKFFPVFLLPILIVWVIFRKSRADGVRDLFLALVGAVVMAAIILLPAVLEGNLMECLAFISDRASTGGESSIIDIIVSKSRVVFYGALLIVSLILALKMRKAPQGLMDGRMMSASFLMMVLCMMYPPAPQYVVVMIPFLVYFAAAEDGRYYNSWLILAVSAFLFVAVTNGSVLMTLAEWTTVMSVDAAMGLFDWYQNTLFGVTYMDIQYYVGGALQYIGIASALLIFLDGAGLLRPKHRKTV